MGAELVVLLLMYFPIISIDPILQPYVTTFENELGLPVIDFPIGFADLPGDRAGVCFIHNERKLVYIDEESWRELDEPRRELLVNHELGHCVLDLDHNEKLSEGCPVSLMHPFLVSYRCMEQYPERYTTRSLGENK